MLDISKINSYDKYLHYNKAEKRNWGGVSVEVRSLIKCLSFGVSSSDRPSLFNHQNLNVMLDTKDNWATRAQKPITAEEIIENILICDSPKNIREGLHAMMLSVFLNYENPTNEFKERIYCTYTTLYNALNQIETLNLWRVEQ